MCGEYVVSMSISVHVVNLLAGHLATRRPCSGFFCLVRFLFSQYLEIFLEYLLGERIDVFSSLDGRQLVPYQAAVLRQQWSRIRTVFSDAFSLQKTAYRRANGGTTAPNVHEDVKPRFLPHGNARGNDISAVESCVPQEPQHKVVVRRTFLEVETVTGLREG